MVSDLIHCLFCLQAGVNSLRAFAAFQGGTKVAPSWKGPQSQGGALWLARKTGRQPAAARAGVCGHVTAAVNNLG